MSFVGLSLLLLPIPYFAHLLHLYTWGHAKGRGLNEGGGEEFCK